MARNRYFDSEEFRAKCLTLRNTQNLFGFINWLMLVAIVALLFFRTSLSVPVFWALLVLSILVFFATGYRVYVLSNKFYMNRCAAIYYGRL
jgi:hypothetical protein